jgi:hypothetical protein
MMTLEELYDDLGKLKWLGADEGWDLAIEAVRTKIREEVVKAKQKEIKLTEDVTIDPKTIREAFKWKDVPKMVDCDNCGKEMMVLDGQHFGHTCFDCSLSGITNVNTFGTFRPLEEPTKERCMFDNFNGTQDPFLGLACTCPKCSPRC